MLIRRNPCGKWPTLVDIFTVYGIINVLSVIVPGPIIIYLANRVKIPAIRNLSILLVGFSVVHGLYHLSFLASLPVIGNILDLVSVTLLILFGLYYRWVVG